MPDGVVMRRRRTVPESSSLFTGCPLLRRCTTLPVRHTSTPAPARAANKQQASQLEAVEALVQQGDWECPLAQLASSLLGSVLTCDCMSAFSKDQIAQAVREVLCTADRTEDDEAAVSHPNTASE